MPIRCPACKKSNTAEQICQRCGTDLSVLVVIRSACRRLMEQSRRYILLGRGDEALSCARYAWELEHTQQAAKLAFLACLLLEYYEQATQWYLWANRELKLTDRKDIKESPKHSYNV